MQINSKTSFTNLTSPESLIVKDIKITDIPNNPQSGINKQYVDSMLASSLGISMLDGLTEIYTSTTHNYQLTNYSAFSTYVITSDVGSVSRLKDVLTITAPNSAAVMKVTIIADGHAKDFYINVLPPSVAKPLITSPINNATDVPSSVTIALTDFIVNGSVDTHIGTDWIVSTDIDFINVVLSLTNSPTELTTYRIQNLTTNTTYYVKVRYNSAIYGYSAWSPVSTFKTRLLFYPNAELSRTYADVPAPNKCFGGAMAISDDGLTLVISEPMDITYKSSINSGCVYIFTKVNGLYVQTNKFISNNAMPGDYFGSSVDISGDGNTVAIGSPKEKVGNYDGGVYIYVRTNGVWNYSSRIYSITCTNSDMFGYKVALNGNGNRIAISATINDIYNISRHGTVFIYDRSGSLWNKSTVLAPLDVAAKDYFGTSLDISYDGNTIIAGSPYATISSNNAPIANAGSVYIYVYNNGSWVSQLKITSSQIVSGENFGYSVSISNDGMVIAIGCIKASLNGLTNSGKVVIYNKYSGFWSLITTLTPNAGMSSDLFGNAVALSGDGNVLAVGAYHSGNYIGENSGSIYVYSNVLGTWGYSTMLLPSNKVANDLNGYSLAISLVGDVLSTGSPYTDINGGNNVGSFYVFI